MKTATRPATVLTFAACREIKRIAGTSPPEFVLTAPTINWSSPVFPARLRMGLFTEFTGASGSYVPRIEVYDAEGTSLGPLVEGRPFISTDPVAVHCICVEEVRFEVPRPGLYDLVLFMNGDEAARRQLWVKPARPVA
jgi:hypothetical protein